MIIILLGMRCVGKTTLGGLLAQRFSLSFYDTDAFFVEQNKVSVGEYIRTYGIESFRKQEYECLKECVHRIQKHSGRGILSTGAGSLTYEKSRALIVSRETIFLWRPLRCLVEDTLCSEVDRPRLTKTITLQEEYATLWAERFPLYMSAAKWFCNVYGTQQEGLERLIEIFHVIEQSQ